MGKYQQNSSYKHQSARTQNPLPLCVQEYLTQSHAEGERNDKLYDAAQQCFWAQIPIADIHGQLLARGMQDGLSEDEADKAIDSGYNSENRPKASRPGSVSHPHQSQQFSRSSSAPPAPTAPPPPPKVTSTLPGTPLPAPIPDGFRVLLQACFKPGELVALSGVIVESNGDAHPGDGDPLTYERWLERIATKTIKQLYSHERGCYLRINPIKAGGKEDEDVTSHRHVLVEFDLDKSVNPPQRVPLEVQYHAGINSGFPIAEVTYSGDKGLHFLVKVDAENDSDLYKERKEAVYNHFRQYSFFDTKNGNPSRYSRCPDIDRAIYNEQGVKIGHGRQELLAINLGPASWAEYEEKTAPRLIEFWVPSQFKNYVESPGVLLIGDYHITRGNVFVIAGPPGIGKSRLLVALGEAGATRYEWLGYTAHCNFQTLIIQSENGKRRMKQELAALDEKILDQYLTITPPPRYGLCFDNQQFRDQIARYLDKHGMPGIVLVDPWNRVTKDDKQKEYMEAFAAVQSLFPYDETGPALGIVAHTRKPNLNERANGRALLNTLAGSLALASVPRTVWVTQSASDAVDETRVVVTCCKNNDGELGPRGVWTRDNGIWPAVTGFDWDAWDNPKGKKTGVAGTSVRIEIMNLVFEGGKKALSGREAVAALKTFNIGRTKAYEALDQNGPFAGHLFQTTGKKWMWKP